MTRPLLWADGALDTPSYGLLAARPGAGRATFGLHYWATDTATLYLCVETGGTTFAWQEMLGGANLAWATQTDWAINATTGSDVAAGTTAAPLATWTEFRRRILAVGGIADNAGQVVVRIETNLPASDPWNLTGIFVGTGSQLHVKGVPTTVYSSVVGVVTAKDPATNVPWSFTDPALPVSWAASGLLDKRGRITAGARAGALFWVVKGAVKSARISSPTIQTASFPFAFDGAPFPTIVAGDPFAMETLPTIAVAIFDAAGIGDASAYARIVVQDLSFPDGSYYARVFGTVAFIGCDNMQMQWTDGIVDAFACRFYALFQFAGALQILLGGYLDGTNGFGSGIYEGEVYLQDFLCQGVGGAMNALGGNIDLQGGGLGVFDAVGPGIDVEAGSVFTQEAGATNLSYGSGNGDVGIQVRSVSSYVYVGTKPTVTGTAGNTRVGGAVLAYAAIPAVTAANNAAIVAYA